MTRDGVTLWVSSEAISRIKRLRRFLKKLRSAVGRQPYYRKVIEQNIQRIEDDKGTLLVLWRKEPSQSVKDTIRQIWDDENEDGSEVHHRWPLYTQVKEE